VERAAIFINEVVYQLLDGFSVQSRGFCSLHAGISSTYQGATGRVGSENFHDEILDIHTESLNSALTPGNMVRIVGRKIKVEGEEGGRGV
jgi:hypothetical protein